MNPNDKAMLEKVKPGWWVQYLNEGYAFNDQWYQVVDREPKYQWVWSPERGMAICPHIKALHAIHAPTDDPQMATAYKLGEPEEVTREEAEKMVKSNWYWLLPDDQQIHRVLLDFDPPLENIILMVETAYAIESPGGNVYRIRENAE